MDAAVLNGNIVVNKIIVASLDVIPGLIDGTGANIGDTWTGKAFVPPRPAVAPIPDVVPMRNARLALYSAGLLADVEAFIAAMEGIEGDLARIDWSTALTVRRDSPLVAELMVLLNITSDQIDALFIAAAAIA